jgi:hypothetical protein
MIPIGYRFLSTFMFGDLKDTWVEQIDSVARIGLQATNRDAYFDEYIAHVLLLFRSIQGFSFNRFGAVRASPFFTIACLIKDFFFFIMNFNVKYDLNNIVNTIKFGKKRGALGIMEHPAVVASIE